MVNLDFKEEKNLSQINYSTSKTTTTISTDSVKLKNLSKTYNSIKSINFINENKSKLTFNKVLNSLALRQLFLDFQFNKAFSMYEPIRKIDAGAFGIVCEAKIINNNNQNKTETKNNTKENQVS